MAAPTLTAVRTVRRGVRSTLRRGMRVRLDPGRLMRPVQSVRRLGRAIRCPVRIAVIGSTRTARQTGIALATSGIASPSSAALP